MFVHSDNQRKHLFCQYEMDCGKNEYELRLNDKTMKISGFCYLVFDCHQWENGVYLCSKSGYYIINRNMYLDELVNLFNKQIQDSYNVGGSKYTESESAIEKLTNQT